MSTGEQPQALAGYFETQVEFARHLGVRVDEVAAGRGSTLLAMSTAPSRIFAGRPDGAALPTTHERAP